MNHSSLLSQLDAERTALLERIAPGIVAVQTPRVRQSAFLWRGGLLVTAAEPLEGAESVRILAEGTPGDAEVLACDLRTDVAVLRAAHGAGGTFDAGSALGAAAQATRAGQTVAVAGRAGSDLTASWGAIALAAGAWTTRRGATLSRRLLLDVRLPSSAEGAPVVDLEAGVVAMAVRGPRDRIIGIPVDAIEAAVSDVAAHGHITQGYLGVRVLPLPLGLQARHRLNAGRAVLVVADVAQPSPAFDAGLEIGDLLLAIDGEALQAPERLLGRIQGKRPGDTLTIARRRGAVLDELTIALSARPRS